MPTYNAINLKAVAVGVGASAGFALVFGLLGGSILSALGFRERPTGPALDLEELVLVLAFTVIGGFVAARRSRERAIVHGAAVGVVLVVLSGVMWLVTILLKGVSSTPLWHNVLVYTCTVPAAAIGGWMASARHAKPVAG
jgi:putative membrane protein (TIGR04086 family)